MPKEKTEQLGGQPDAEETPKISALDGQSRLRSGASTTEPLHVVLLEPEIPPNTGNVARLCAATRSVLHLIHPLGFRVDEKSVRRAGLDYWHLVKIVEHENWDSFQSSLAQGARYFFFTGKASRSFLEASYRAGDYLIFGRESTGLPEALLNEHRESLVGIPTLGEVRSLNLANAVTLGVYEALRQMGQLENAILAPLGRQ